jgi:signal transduction histidine kinase
MPQLDDEPRAHATDRNEQFIQIGILSSIVFTILLAIASVVATQEVVRSLSAVAFEDAADLVAVQNLRIAADEKGRKARSFFVSGNEEILHGMNTASDQFSRRLRTMQAKASEQTDVELLERIDVANREYQVALDRVIGVRKTLARSGSAVDDTSGVFELEVQPAREELDRAIIDLASLEDHRLHEATVNAKATVSRSIKVLLGLAAIGLIAAVVLATLLTRALSQLRRQRHENARQLRRVEELNLELDAFAGRVAHDLRNLISPIAMAPTMLRRATDSPQKIVGVADRIQRATDRSLAMLDGLLAFSRSGRPAPSASCSVIAVLDDVMDQLTPLAAQVGATVERNVEDAVVACSSELLSVVVMNLVGNALKFLEGSVTRKVSIAVRSSDPNCQISIRDTGPGIPKEALDHVFEPFYRVPGTKAPGTGIGLATVRRIVEAHGGSITAMAAPNCGTTLEITLPLGHAESADSMNPLAIADDDRGSWRVH